MDDRQAEYNQLVHWAVGVLSPNKKEPGPDIGELKAAEVDQYIATRTNEADRLMKALDNELLSQDDRQGIIARLDVLADELKRGATVKKKLERQASAA